MVAKTKHPVAVAPSTSASVVVDANGARTSLFLQSFGTVRVYLGKDANVTVATAICFLDQGDTAEDDSTDDWWAITAAGTGDLRGFEVF